MPFTFTPTILPSGEIVAAYPGCVCCNPIVIPCCGGIVLPTTVYLTITGCFSASIVLSAVPGSNAWTATYITSIEILPGVFSDTTLDIVVFPCYQTGPLWPHPWPCESGNDIHSWRFLVQMNCRSSSFPTIFNNVIQANLGTVDCSPCSPLYAEGDTLYPYHAYNCPCFLDPLPVLHMVLTD